MCALRLCVCETLGIFLKNHVPGGEDKRTSFRNKLEIVLIPMEKHDFEVSKAIKTHELALVEGYGIVKSEDLGQAAYSCLNPQLEGTCSTTSSRVLALAPHLLA